MESIEKQKAEIAIQEKELQTKEFFDSWPRKRLFAFIVFSALIIPLFFVAKFGSAEIYLKGFAKRQIYPHQAPVEAQDIQIIETKALTMLGDRYSAYAQIKNPNKDLVVSNLEYTFRFYDSAGIQLGQESSETYLLGGEQKYLILPNIRLQQAPAKVVVEIVKPDWKKRLEIPNVIVNAGVPSYQDVRDPEAFEITGNIQNVSTYKIGTVRINALVFDQSGQIIAVTQRTENDLAAKEVRDYKMTWPLPLAANISLTPKIIVEVNVLDPDNLK